MEFPHFVHLGADKPKCWELLFVFWLESLCELEFVHTTIEDSMEVDTIIPSSTPPEKSTSSLLQIINLGAAV